MSLSSERKRQKESEENWKMLQRKVMVLASTTPSDEAQPSDAQNEFTFPAPPGKDISCSCFLLKRDTDHIS